MQATFNKLPGSRIDLKVNLTKEEFLPYYETAFQRALSNVHLKGFRPGIVPKELAEKAVDREEVFNEAAKNAIHWSLDEVSKDNNWTLIDAPRIEVENSKDLGIAYKAELTVFPDVKLGNYKKIAHKVMQERKEQTIEQKEIDQTLEWIRNSRKQGDKIPELNDELAKSLGKFQNLEELRKSIGDGIKMEKETKEADRLRLKILEEIIKTSEIDLPEIMIRKTYDNIYKQLSPILKASGKPEEEIKKEAENRARNNIATNLVIYKIAQIERLEPTKEEVHQKEGSVENEKNYDYIYGVLQNQKVFSFLESLK